MVAVYYNIFVRTFSAEAALRGVEKWGKLSLGFLKKVIFVNRLKPIKKLRVWENDVINNI